MRTLLPAVMMAAALALAGCSYGSNPLEPAGQQTAARHIEVEVANLETGLPCKVIDRPDADRSNVLWRAEFEEGFCRRKAEETRLILEDKGWTCQRQDQEEQRDLVRAPAGQTKRSHLVAAWRCVEDPRPIAVRPPVPSAKPEFSGSRSASWGDERLQATVEKDLAAIGQEVIDEETAVDAALGDLNEDGVDDAIVILTRDAERGAAHRMLMAYLRSADTYSLVDVWILDAPEDRADGGLTLAIEDGLVRLENCCENPNDPTTLVLADRKLAYAQGG